MSHTFDEVRKDLSDLLDASTYTYLKEIEKSLKDKKGIDITEDFIITDNRQAVLDGLRNDFGNVVRPTAILTGYYGSGKTAILHYISEDFEKGQLSYGHLQVVPLDIQLNVSNTISKFLSKLLSNLSNLKSEEWLLDVYQKQRDYIHLPQLTENSIRGIIISLVSIESSSIAKVWQFLETLLKDYKKSNGSRKVITLIVDELEYITNLDVHGKEENQLSALLKHIINTSVREQFKEPAISDPDFLNIFSIPEWDELSKSDWLKRDTAERCKPIEKNVNLTTESSVSLMKKMLRLYLAAILDVAVTDTKDTRLHAWNANLHSTNDINDDKYTYPISPEIHSYVANRILLSSPDKKILSFRAYQVFISTLLKQWEGDNPIDMRFAIREVDKLRFNLRGYGNVVELNNLVGEEQIESLVKKHCQQMTAGQQYQLTHLTIAAIVNRSAPLVHLRHEDVENLFPEQKILTRSAFLELCGRIRTIAPSNWSANVDQLIVNTQEILDKLQGPIVRLTEEEQLKGLLESTRKMRGSLSVLDLCHHVSDRMHNITSHFKDSAPHKVLHIKDNTPRGQYIEEYLLSYDGELSSLSNTVNDSIGLRIAVLFSEGNANNVDEIPFDVSVILPTILQSRASKYSELIHRQLSRHWIDRFKPLMIAVGKYEDLAMYDAFKEVFKIFLLWENLDNATQKTFAKFKLDVLKLVLDSLSLEANDKDLWLAEKLGLASIHQVDATYRLIQVLSTLEEQESLVYEHVPKVNLHSSFRKAKLSTSDEWENELKSEWKNEDFISNDRLTPYKDWKASRRDLYDKVHQAVNKKSLTVSAVEKILLGDCHIGVSTKARSSIHLFIKLGKLSPLGWSLNDDVSDYSGLEITAGDIIHEQTLKQLQLSLHNRIHKLALNARVSDSENKKTIIEQLRNTIHIRDQVNESLPLPTLQKLLEQLNEITMPSITDRYYIPQQLISKCPSNMTKLGEFLNKLNEMTKLDRWTSYIISPEIMRLVNELEIDLACESVIGKIKSLYGNWNKQIDFEIASDRMLVKITTDYTNNIGQNPRWVMNFVKETDETFSQKLSKIQLKSVEDDLNGICTWMEQQSSRIIKKEWVRSYSEEDVGKYTGRLKNSEDLAKKEIEELADKVKNTQNDINDALGNPAFTRKQQDVKEFSRQLGQDAWTLSHMPNQLYSSKFNSSMSLIAKHIQEWDDFYVSVVKTQEGRIKDWMKKRNLSDKYKDIIEALDLVKRPISQLYAELKQQGIDPISLLIETKASPILTLFAAAELDQVLKSEVSDANSG